MINASIDISAPREAGVGYTKPWMVDVVRHTQNFELSTRAAMEAYGLDKPRNRNRTTDGH